MTTATADINEKDDRCCRLCYGDFSDGVFIAPCLCAGSMKWIHVSCLNTHRLNGTDPSFFSVSGCTLCKQKYKLRNTKVSNTRKGWSASARVLAFERIAIYILKRLLVLAVVAWGVGLFPVDLRVIFWITGHIGKLFFYDSKLSEEEAKVQIDSLFDGIEEVFPPTPLLFRNETWIPVWNAEFYTGASDQISRGLTTLMGLLGAVQFMSLSIVRILFHLRGLMGGVGGKKNSMLDSGFLILVAIVLFVVWGAVSVGWQFLTGLVSAAKDKVGEVNAKTRQEIVERYQVLNYYAGGDDVDGDGGDDKKSK